MSMHDNALGLIRWQMRGQADESFLPAAPLMVVAENVMTDSPAGKLLTAMLAAIDLQRDNVVIIHPEVIEETLRSVKPACILCMGDAVARQLLLSDQPVEVLRHQVYQYGSDLTPLIVTYHPEHLLLNPADKRGAWADLQKVKKF